MMIKDLDLALLQEFKPSSEGLLDLGDSLESASEYLLKSTHKHAVYVLGEFIAITGVTINESLDSAHVWMIGSDSLQANPIASLEGLMFSFKNMFKNYPHLKTLYTFNLLELRGPIRFLKSMGFYEAEIYEGFHDGKERIKMILEV